MKFNILYIIFSLLFSRNITEGAIFDKMEKREGWKTEGDKGAIATIKNTVGKKAKAIEMNYTFIHGNWLQMKKNITNGFKDAKAISFYYNAEGSLNNFEIKLEDADGTLHGISFQGVTSSDGWTKITIALSDFKYWWGKNKTLDLNKMSKIYFVISKSEGGSGNILIDHIEIHNTELKTEAKFSIKYKKIINNHIDMMNKLTGWKSETDNDSKAVIYVTKKNKDRALKLKYNFLSGKWLQMKKLINCDLSKNSKIKFNFSGTGHINIFQLKLEDEEGNVFGRDFGNIIPSFWKEIKIDLNSLEKFWGKGSKLNLSKIKKIYFVVIAKDGEKGHIIINNLIAE